jgi:hypothetical protein
VDASTAPATQVQAVKNRAATPIAGSITGILFAILFSAAVLLMVGSVSELATDTGAWLESGARNFRIGLGLLPFAGIFFLWFIAVARQHVGQQEDQFFATVFLGSGLLFLAMIFTAAAAAGAIVASYARDAAGFGGSTTYLFARHLFAQIFNVYALRMAAVFVLSQATIWMRTGVMPKWLAFLSYAVALVLLFVVSQATIVVLIFPAWVLLISAFILAKALRRTAA